MSDSSRSRIPCIEFTAEEYSAIKQADSVDALLQNILITSGTADQKAGALGEHVGIALPPLNDLSKILATLLDKVQIVQERYANLQLTHRVATNFISSPIYKLPNEMIIAIMLHAVTGQDIAQYPATIRLAQVSRRWRMIVNSSPALWASITILDSSTIPATFPRLLKTVQLYLEKSDPHSLALNADLPSLDSSDLRKLFDVALNNSHRLRCLRLAFKSGAVIRGALRFPILTSLFINGSRQRLPYLDVFQSLPAIHHLHLSNSTLYESLTALPWQQIHVLTCMKARFQIFPIAILASENLTIMRIHHWSGSGFVQSRVRLPRLECLRIVCEECLDAFETPSLQKLAIECRRRALIPAIKLIHRSGCPLMELSILLHLPPSIMNLCPLFSVCPGVTSLAIGASRSSNLEHLYDFLAIPFLLPNLSHMSVGYGSDVKDVLIKSYSHFAYIQSAPRTRLTLAGASDTGSAVTSGDQASRIRNALRVRLAGASPTLQYLSLVNIPKSLLLGLNGGIAGLCLRWGGRQDANNPNYMLPAWAHVPTHPDQNN